MKFLMNVAVLKVVMTDTHEENKSSWGSSNRYLGTRTPHVNCKTSSQNLVELWLRTSYDMGLKAFSLKLRTKSKKME